MSMIKLITRSIFLSTILICCVSIKTHATDIKPSLKITPDRCISLHKGQTCYQKITIHWQSAIQADYCLFQKGIVSPLQCWKASRNGELKIDIQSTKPIDYELRRQGEHSPFATSSLSIHWVYKSTKRQKRGWRLF